ncbi:MAG: tRNA preQ1(34) S-adenosylmethionine ribosyltransferase-isomerase QueA [Sinobacteraceae bacterium]|nr:tRNA preQ1(34) S-adenosylmethionine ribosyltransferase-isomerase QueA [Nevskiaceae bacterium]
MQRHDFAYELPAELIAQIPLAERAASRLLILQDDLQDRMFQELPVLLRSGDLLVLNDTRVIAARLLGKKPSGGRVEIFLERVLSPDTVLAQLRASKPIREGLEVATGGGVVRILGREGDLWRVQTPGTALAFFERWGQVPLPPYIHRHPTQADRERYQSVFARDPGAVAAPTASLHFDAALLERLAERGIGRAFITLHVGAGTFQPLRSDDLDSHVMHAERVSVSAATRKQIHATRAAGGRIVAVGTTVVRALESAALQPPSSAENNLSDDPGVAGDGAGDDWSGETRLFIRPGFRFQLTDLLITNFHLPESTLLMLVCAFGGRQRVLAAYQHAVRERYRFFSYGDAMLLTRQAPAP